MPYQYPQNFFMKTASGIKQTANLEARGNVNRLKEGGMNRTLTKDIESMPIRVERYLMFPLRTLADQFRKLQTPPRFPDAFCPYITTPEEIQIEAEKAKRVNRKVRRKAAFGADLFGMCTTNLLQTYYELPNPVERTPECWTITRKNGVGTRVSFLFCSCDHSKWRLCVHAGGGG